MCREASWGSNREGTSPHNKCGHTPIDLCGGIRFRRKVVHASRGGSMDQLGVTKEGNWPKVNKDGGTVTRE